MRRAMDLPKAYALGLWLRNLDLDEGQIAEALGMEPEAVRPLLEIAQLKMDRLQAAPRVHVEGPPGVLVFLHGTRQDVVDAGAELALERGCPLHLVASPRCRAADVQLMTAAVKAFRSRIDVVPHAANGCVTDVVRSVVRSWGPVTIIIDAESDDRRAYESVGTLHNVDAVIVDDLVPSICGLRRFPRDRFAPRTKPDPRADATHARPQHQVKAATRPL